MKKRTLESEDKTRVLIVEDEKSSLDVLEEYLTIEEFHVLTASDGIAAIKTIEEEDLDIVLTDLQMPGADGIDVLKAAKKVNRDLHVIIVTGYASLETTLQAIKEGAYDYIIKPYKLEEVAVVLGNASERVRLEREKVCLIDCLRKACEELDTLRQSKTDLDKNVEEINKKMEEDQVKIAEHLKMLQILPGNSLPLYCLQTKGSDKDRMFERLERFVKLRQDGVLTEEEFRLCKERLLTQV